MLLKLIYSTSYVEKEMQNMTSSPNCFILITLFLGLKWGSPGPWFSVNSWELDSIAISTLFLLGLTPILVGGSADADFSFSFPRSHIGAAPFPVGQFHKETAFLSLLLHLSCVCPWACLFMCRLFQDLSSQVCFGTCNPGSSLKQNGWEGTEMGFCPGLRTQS